MLDVFIHSSAFVDEGAVIGEGTRIWHFCHVMPQAIIGRKCSLGQNCFVANHVVIGDNVKVQNNVSVYEGVQISDDVFIGPSVVFTNVINPRSEINRQGEYKFTRLEKGVTIGANATIVCGVSLGMYSFIGAGAVVTKDVQDFAVMVGNPARLLGWISRAGERLYFDDQCLATCSLTQEIYRIENNKVYKFCQKEE